MGEFFKNNARDIAAVKAAARGYSQYYKDRGYGLQIIAGTA